MKTTNSMFITEEQVTKALEIVLLDFPGSGESMTPYLDALARILGYEHFFNFLENNYERYQKYMHIVSLLHQARNRVYSVSLKKLLHDFSELLKKRVEFARPLVEKYNNGEKMDMKEKIKILAIGETRSENWFWCDRGVLIVSCTYPFSRVYREPECNCKENHFYRFTETGEIIREEVELPCEIEIYLNSMQIDCSDGF